MNKEIKKTAIIGMGALGMLYASQISSAFGPDSVYFLADQKRIGRYQKLTFTINGTPWSFPMKAPEDAGPADLIIIAVKYNALPSALDLMASSVGPDTTIISVMNGIDSEAIAGKRYGDEKVLYCIAQGMDAMKFGTDLTYTRSGELCLGTRIKGQENRLDALTTYFDSARISYRTESDILKRLWGKFMLNVGINQTCMAYEANYAQALTPGTRYDTLIGAMREVILLAQKEGITLTEGDLEAYIELLKTLSPEGVPSMRQDGIAHRPSEVEMFSGTVRRLAAKHGLSVPVNDMLYKKIKDMESTYIS
ncbi:ketopantoate reductase family protein [Lacrimispora defluvii]|uniref:2-dehydropantoate 2-reductase n=1 Tax=Lacrimispora defluvii TaxID=2719233 RepID=A0ABX1VSM7_9FIRM|nr:ketopantoate reductase family protein [Lacrimispora defluvii]NNJ31453.1 ketopantoate reductase family protein [Lacrimispora defluvii]